MTKVAQLLTQDGYLVIGDIIEAHAVNREEMKGVYERLGLPNLGDGVTYDRVFTQNGLTKIVNDCSPEVILRHYGAVKYNASVGKKEELLKNGVTQEFIDK